MAGSFARRTLAPDYPWGPAAEQQRAFIDQMEADWGGSVGIEDRSPSLAHDERYRQWWARWLRSSASPAAAANLMRMNMEIDVRHVLPAVRVPTLLLHSIDDRLIEVGASRYMAAQIPGAKLVELRGIDHIPWGCDSDQIVDEIEEFITGARAGDRPVYRYRRRDRARQPGRRPQLARFARQPPHLGSPRAGEFSRPRNRHGG
jgi:pimeloyl-ACP methyl ester carboxylesterase